LLSSRLSLIDYEEEIAPTTTATNGAAATGDGEAATADGDANKKASIIPESFLSLGEI
jgi:ATP-dependent RNA helicase UAP56/SUB2